MDRNNKNLWVLYEAEVPHSRFCHPAFGVSPAERLSPEHLQLLKNAFTCPKGGLHIQENRPEGSRRGGGEEHGMKFEEFRGVLRSVIGPDIEDTWVERFFSEVDISCSGQIKWQQLCSYLFLEYTERQRASVPTAALLDTQPQIRHCSHNKRDPTVRVVAFSHPPPLFYISVSKGGHITVWSGSLHILKTLVLAGDPTEEVANTRRFRGWTTDAVCMGNIHKVAIATDCRDLHFVNVTLSSVYEDVHLFGFRSVLTALCYWHDVQFPERPPLLLMGDDKGGIHLMWFLNPSKGLFKSPPKKDTQNPQRIFFPDLNKHNDMISYRHIPNIHQEAINRIMFDPSTNVIMTSSESDTTSVVFMNVSLRREPHIWKIKQGVKCFDYNASLQLLVTSGCDRTIRLWTRYVTSRPVASLLGHHTTVLDVVIYQPAGQIFSYSRDSEVRVWDTLTHQCLKTVRLLFPCLQTGRIPEHGNFPFLLLSPPLPDETQPHLVVGCKDYLAVLNLAEARRGGCGWLRDEGREGGTEMQRGAALLCALYNPTLRLVVTGHVDSSVSLWDVETGRRRLQILNAHGEDELTCMALDSSHRRLITGARSGTIKVWNLLNGLNLLKLEPITNSEVTGLTCLHDNQLLAVGWSQRIAQYDIEGAKDLNVRADMSWKSSGVHKSDILAVTQCPVLGIIATASYDGEVVIWRLETQGPLLHLRDTQVALPVDNILFLQYRTSNKKLRNKGVLVSSQGGSLCFWSITGEKHGQFYAPEPPSECVLSLSSDQLKNNILVSGDTTGWLQIWDISSYALDIQPNSACERPSLLHSWKAHKKPLVFVEILEVSGRVFILTASVDGSSGLWTKNGNHVGCFGQVQMWNITDPATYQRETQNNLQEVTTESDEARPSEVRSPVPDPSNQSQTSDALSTGQEEADHKQPQQPMYPSEDHCQRTLCQEGGHV